MINEIKIRMKRNESNENILFYYVELDGMNGMNDVLLVL